MTGRKAKVRIVRWDRSWTEVDGEVYGRHLALTPTVHGIGFTITHLRTGRAVSQTLKGLPLKRARAIVSDLAKLRGWSLTRRDVRRPKGQSLFARVEAVYAKHVKRAA